MTKAFTVPVTNDHASIFNPLVYLTNEQHSYIYIYVAGRVSERNVK